MSDAELSDIVTEILNRSPEDIFAEHSAHSTVADARNNTLDLNQPLMQLFLRSFLPWNHVDPSPSIGRK